MTVDERAVQRATEVLRADPVIGEFATVHTHDPEAEQALADLARRVLEAAEAPTPVRPDRFASVSIMLLELAGIVGIVLGHIVAFALLVIGLGWQFLRRRPERY